MFVLTSDITIGAFKNVKPIQVTVSRSIYDYVDNCKIQIPITSRIIRSGEVVTQATDTAKLFKEGDKAVVKLGYNGILNTEFEGFICRVNLSTPIELEFEGYSYQLRNKTLSGVLVSTTLKKILQTIIAGTDIVLASNIPDFRIDKIVLNGKNGCDVLESIKGTSKQLIKFYFDKNVLHANLQFVEPKYAVKFRLGYNVIKDNNLKLREAKNQTVKVNWVGQGRSGTKVNVSTGSGGNVKTRVTHMVSDKKSLQQLADAEHKSLSYDGYEGKITAFGVPFIEPGCKVVLEDVRYKERSGNYIASDIKVKYARNGFRRTIGIGHKL